MFEGLFSHVLGLGFFFLRLRVINFYVKGLVFVRLWVIFLTFGS